VSFSDPQHTPNPFATATATNSIPHQRLQDLQTQVQPAGIYSYAGSGLDHFALIEAQNYLNATQDHYPSSVADSAITGTHSGHNPSISGPHSSSLSVSGFTDLDALFDDLTSFDGVEAGFQPQFMQNLGFAPNANLAEFMGFERG